MIVMKKSLNGKDLNITALSIIEVSNLIWDGAFGKHVIVSIQSPDYDSDVEIPSHPLDVMRMRFHDTTKTDAVFDRAYTDEDASRVCDFVERWIGNVNAFITHGEGGISRSVGMAAAIAKVYFGDDATFFRQGNPNNLVYSKTLNELVRRGIGGA